MMLFTDKSGAADFPVTKATSMKPSCTSENQSKTLNLPRKWLTCWKIMIL